MKGRTARCTLFGVGFAAGLGVEYVRRVEPWLRHWGATEAESSATLPVDELVEPDARSITRAITVRAPVDDVWPWLVQIGQDRAGFYSYTWLENLVGAGMRNARSVHPEWQARRTGDTVSAHEREALGRPRLSVRRWSGPHLVRSSSFRPRTGHGCNRGGRRQGLGGPGTRRRVRDEVPRPQLGRSGRHTPLRCGPFSDGAEVVRGLRDRAEVTTA